MSNVSNEFLSVKSKKIDSKFSTKTKTKTFQNLNMPPPISKMKALKEDNKSCFTKKVIDYVCILHIVKSLKSTIKSY